MSIYTKKGDKGKTSNVLGNIYSKSYILMELQGGIDEINAGVGYLRSILSRSINDSEELQRIDGFLKKIQYNLFCLGAEVSQEFTKNNVKLTETELVEREIDYMTEKLLPLSNFIYQSGNEAASYAHVVRSVIRRVERVYVRVLEDKEYPESYQFINRLSDYFFTLARFFNHISDHKEEILLLK